MARAVLFVGLVTLLLAVGPAGAQPAGSPVERPLGEQALAARGQVEQSVRALRAAEARGGSDAGELRSNLAQAEAAYRRAVAAQILAQGPPTPEEAAAAQRAVEQHQAELRQAVAGYLADRLPAADSDQRVALYADAEASLRALRLEAEVRGEAARRVQPLLELNGAAPGERVQRSTTAVRMGDLLHRVATTDTNEVPAGSSEVGKEVETWLRTQERDASLAEYQRLARYGQVVSPRDGRPMTGLERERLEADAERQLAETVAWHARDKRLFDGTEVDSRRALGERLQSEVSSSAEYQALDYLTPGQENMPQYYRALANAVRRRQSEMDEWYTRDYLGQSEADTQRSSTGNAAHAWWSTGFGTLARANDISGDTSNAHVTATLESMRRDTDAAAEAFMAAAGIPDPAQLPSRQRELLQAYGYISEGPDRKLSYALPTGRRDLGNLTRADLPGASWLDAINMEGVAVTAASVALPQLASARLAAWATRAGYTARTVEALGATAGVVAGVGVDAGTQLVQTGTVDVQRTLLDNLLVGTLAGKAAGLAESGVTKGLSWLVKDSKLAAALKNGGTASALVRETEALVANAAGLGTESALQAYWQSIAQGNPGLTYEDFLATAASCAMGRVMAGHRSARADDLLPYERTVTGLTQPGPLRDMLLGSSALALEERGRTRELAEGNRSAWERFMKATDNGRNVDAATLDAAIRRGEFSWPEMKVVAADAPDQLGPIHDGIARARQELVERVDGAARHEASRELAGEYDGKLAEFRARGLQGEELAGETARLDAWRKEEQGKIDAPAQILGSMGKGSDIDRSWASDRVQRAAKRIEDTLLRPRDAEVPGPTTARAYDLNEYYDVMPMVGKMYAEGLSPTDQPGTRVESMGVDLTHGELQHANGLASAMMHLDEGQRNRFEQNKLAAAPPEQRVKLEAEFAWARRNLEEQAGAVRDKVRELGLDPADPDAALRARDALYADRVRELAGLERRIAAEPDPQGPEARRLRAEWEQKMSVGLREGIECYTQPAALDLIVNEWQGKKIPDPVTGEMRKRTIDELLGSRDFTLAGELGKKYTPGQIDGMLNDQVMFLMEHVNGYRDGHESPEAAARALGKYGERALLALNIQGTDVRGNPELARLLDTTKAIMASKDNPAELRKLLAGLDPSGDPDRGLRKVMQQLEAVPGLQGLLGPGPSEDPASRALTQQAALRRRERERAEARAAGGPEAELEVVRRQQAETDAELVRSTEATASQQDLDGRYLRKDQPEARRLEREIAADEDRLRNLPLGEANETGLAHDLRAGLEERRARLAKLGQDYQAAGSPKDQGDPTDASRRARLEDLASTRTELATTRDRLEAHAEEERRRAAMGEAIGPGMPPSLVVTTPGATPVGPAPGTPAPRAARSGRAPAFPPEPEEEGLPLPRRPGEPGPPTPASRPSADATVGGPARSASGGGLTVTIPQSTYRIGTRLQVTLECPSDEKYEVPGLLLLDRFGEPLTTLVVAKGKGSLGVDLPILAGTCALRADAPKGKGTLFTLPVPVVATPTPGAMSIRGGAVQGIGAKVKIGLAAPAGTWCRSPWVGLFRPNMAGGPPVRVQSWNPPGLNGTLDVQLPSRGGDYELRLYDRDEGFYQLDALSLRVVPRATPGALGLARNSFVFGETVEVALAVPESVYLDTWAFIGLFELAHAGPESSSAAPKIASEWLKTRKGSVKFKPPARQGSYEFRLYDRENSGFLLDRVRFTVLPAPAPGALALARGEIAVGEKLEVRLAVPESVFLDTWARVALFQLDHPTGTRGTAPMLQSVWVSSVGRTGLATFVAPDTPTLCEVRLLDRESDGLVLDARAVKVVTRPAPGALGIPKNRFALDEPIPVSVKVPAGVHLFIWSNVTLQPANRPGFDPRPQDQGWDQRAYLDQKTLTATLRAPRVPGSYELRLYDRDSCFNWLDRRTIEVVAAAAPGALKAPASAVAGSQVSVGYSIPAGTFRSDPLLELVEPAHRVPGGALVDDQVVSRAWVGKEASGTLELGGPARGGSFELRLLDRSDGDRVVLDRARLQVADKPKGP